MLELDGISRESVEAHYKLYTLDTSTSATRFSPKLADVDLSAGNQIYSDGSCPEGRSVTFAIGGVKNHEIYFAHLGGGGGDPSGLMADLIARDFGSLSAWRDDLRATGMAGRGWAWTAYDWDEERLFNFIGDAQNTFPVWNATPLVALDVYEHAYFLDYGTDRPGYIEAFFANLRLGRHQLVGRAVRDGALDHRPLRRRRRAGSDTHPAWVPARQHGRGGTGSRSYSGASTSDASGAATWALPTSGERSASNMA